MKIFRITCILVSLSCTLVTASRLYPYRKGNKFGFVNENLEFIIPCLFDDVEDGIGDQVIVSRNGKKGILRMDTGETLVPVAYDELWFYFYGLDVPLDRYECELDGKEGIIDSTGTFEIPCAYEDIHIYHDRTTAYVKLDGKWGLMYPRGNLVTPIIYDTYDTFLGFQNLHHFRLGDTNYFIDTLGNILNTNGYDFDGLMYWYVSWMLPETNRLIVGRENKWGVIDYKNNIVIPIMHDSVVQHYHGLFIVYDSGKCGLLDEDGNTLLPVEYDDIDWCDTFLFKIEKNDRWAFFNSDTNILGDFIYETIGPLGDFRKYAKKNGKYGMLDRSGEEITEFIYDKIKSADEHGGHYYGVKRDGKWGFIDTLGNEVLPFQYDDVWTFFKFEAYVMKDEEYGVIDFNGNEIVPFDAGYEHGWGIGDSLYEIKVNGKWGLIKAPNNILIEPVYDNIMEANIGMCNDDITDSLLELKLDEKLGFADRQGNIIVQSMYDRIDIGSSSIRVCLGEKYGVLDRYGNVILPVQYDAIYWYSERMNMGYVKRYDVWFYALKNGIELYEP